MVYVPFLVDLFWKEIRVINEFTNNNNKFYFLAKKYLKTTEQSSVQQIINLSIEQFIFLNSNLINTYFSFCVKDIKIIILSYLTHNIQYSRLLICKKILDDNDNFCWQRFT